MDKKEHGKKLNIKGLTTKSRCGQTKECRNIIVRLSLFFVQTNHIYLLMIFLQDRNFLSITTRTVLVIAKGKDYNFQ